MKLFQSSQVHSAPKNIFGFVYIFAFMFLGAIDPSQDDPHIGKELNDPYEKDEDLNQFIDSLLNFPGEEKQTTSRDAGDELVCSNKNVELIVRGGFQDSEKERIAKSIREGDIECLSDMLDPFINDNTTFLDKESELPDFHITSPTHGSNTTSVIKTDLPDSGISNDSCSFMGQTSDGLTTWEGSQSVPPQTIPNNEISTSLPKLMHQNLISVDGICRPQVNGQWMPKSNSLTPVYHPDGVTIAFRTGSQIGEPEHTSSSLQSQPKPRKRKQVVFGGVPSSTEDRQCLHCGTRSTPQWRSGPKGRKTLCNACGVRHTSGRLLPEYRPRKSPTFKEAEHSNSHRRVVQIRKEKNLDDPNDKQLQHQEWLRVTDEELFSTLPLYSYSNNPPRFYYV